MSYGIGKRIKERREELGLTQLQLAERMGYTSKAAVCKVERGDDNITADRVSRFANALNCSESYLMGWEIGKQKTIFSLFEESSDKDNSNLKRVPSRDEMVILYLTSKLNDDGFNEAIKRIEELTQLDKYKKG